MFTRKLQITIILILITSVCLSQPTKNNFEKMIDQKCKFIKTELQLTEDQDKAFMPIFREFELKRKELHDKKRDLLNNYDKNSLNMSADELTKLSDEFVEVDSKMAQLGNEYHQKFKKVLPPVKLILLYKADHDFKKQLLKKMKDSKDDKCIGE